jgi:hypothetical protein
MGREMVDYLPHSATFQANRAALGASEPAVTSDFGPCAQENPAWLRLIPRYELRPGPR